MKKEDAINVINTMAAYLKAQEEARRSGDHEEEEFFHKRILKMIPTYEEANKHLFDLEKRRERKDS